MNLGIVCPNPEDGTSLMRGFGCFNYIARECGVRLIRHEEWGWPEITECDCVFLQRPSCGDYLRLARSVKSCRVPLWVEHDDDLTSIPMMNQSWSAYSWPQVQANIREIVRLADVLTVCSPALKHLREDAVVIPNALNTYIWGFSTRPRAKRIVWRGTKTHWGDQEPFIAAMWAVAKARPEWEWVFLGQPHWRLEGLGRVIPQTTHFDMMANLYSEAGAIHVVPLVDCLFNRVKSNVAWLEATAAGSAVLGPAMPEWERPGITLYRTPEEFEQKLLWLLDLEDDAREVLAKTSRDYIRSNLTLPVVNQQRIEILRRFDPAGPR